MEYVRKSAIISDCDLYRYMLLRTWSVPKPAVVFLMLNPSKADGDRDDHTIRKCVSIADFNGYGTLVVVNLFAYRSTDCMELRAAVDPVGPANDQAIEKMCAGRPVVCAWGSRKKIATPRLMDRPQVVKKILRDCGAKAYQLRLTKDHDPYHPLLLPGVSVFAPWAI